MVSESRLGLTFHRTFSLSRDSVAKILRLASEGLKINKDMLAEKSSLGTIYQEAMPRYARGCGLLDGRNRLTVFGRFAAQHDPGLEKLATLWLLHYHLASPQSPTAFWHDLVRRRFLAGNSFTADDLMLDLAGFLQEKAGKSPAPRSIRSTITVFTGTYLKADGLGRLKLLEKTTEDTFFVPMAEAPPLWALGYALADYWNAHYGERLTINLDDLTQGDFAAIFLLGEERLTQLLLQLKQEGMLDLYRISRPYQVVLLQPNPEFALQKMYKI